MDHVNLAYTVEQSGGNWQPLLDLVRHHVVPFGIVVGVGVSVIWWVLAYRWTKRQPHEPKVERATLRGTAQVLSFKEGHADWSYGEYRDYETSFNPFRRRQIKRDLGHWCNIQLEVHIPGREQYVTVVRKLLRPAEQAAVQRGNTVQVRVDPNDDPKNVRIDFDQPIT